MRKSLYITAIVLLLSACDDRFEFANRDNRAPKLFFLADESKTSLTDSLKLGTDLKIGGPSFTLELSAKDPEGKLNSVNFRIESGSAKFYNGTTQVTKTITIQDNVISLIIVPDGPGTITVVFEASDNIGKSAAANFTLVSFDNLAPIASATLVSTKISGPYEYEFDASASHDQDKNFGGEVTAYEYVINDSQTIITSNKIIKHNFPGPGGYRVKYRVHDNEGATSAFITAPQITLQ